MLLKIQTWWGKIYTWWAAMFEDPVENPAHIYVYHVYRVSATDVYCHEE